MSQCTFKNPFFECTGKDIDYKDVLEYWCDPFTLYNLDEQVLFGCPTAYILQGARGSGKTMILKYLSFHCQKKKAAYEGHDDMFKYFSELGSIGVYLNYKEDSARLIENLAFNDDVKYDIFKYYYELFISLQTVIAIGELSSFDINNEYMDKEGLIDDFNAVFNSSASSINEMTNMINKEIKNIDDWMKMCRYISNPEVLFYGFVKEKLIQKLIASIRNRISIFHDINLLVLLDEYENMGKWQIVTNTFIKQKEGGLGLMYRVGTRPEGMNNKTLIGDNLQNSRDFILHDLLVNKDNRGKWNIFLKEVAGRRLELCGYDRDIVKFLGSRENIVDESLRIAKKNHFDLLEHLGMTSNQVDGLRCIHNPLIEMMNILWAIRGKKAADIREKMLQYLENKTENTKYKRDFTDKYKYQLLLCLANYNRVPKEYYSFTTFSFLSHGSVNDFISLCRNTFIHLDDEYYSNMSNSKTIPISIQSKGAHETAIDLLNNLELNNENGIFMHTFIRNLGKTFKNFNRICKNGKRVESFAKYPETNQFVFVNETEISTDEGLSVILRRLVKWGAITKVREIKRKSLDLPQIGYIYKINPVFSPLFSLSYRTRGGYNHPISKEKFWQMLSSDITIKTNRKTKENKEIYNSQQMTIGGINE